MKNVKIDSKYVKLIKFQKEAFKAQIQSWSPRVLNSILVEVYRENDLNTICKYSTFHVYAKIWRFILTPLRVLKMLCSNMDLQVLKQADEILFLGGVYLVSNNKSDLEFLSWFDIFKWNFAFDLKTQPAWII